MIYGYARISTRHQSIERQIRNIKEAYPEAYIFQEAYTGTTIDRPQFRRLTKIVKPGDTIVFDSVSRMSRDSEMGFKLYEELYSKNIDLIFLNEPHINSTTYKACRDKVIPLTNSSVDYILEGINKYLMELARQQIALAFEVAQKETDDLHTRTRQGLITAKLNGKTLGHRKGTPLITKKSIKCREIIMKHSRDFGGNLSDIECMRLCGCSKKSYYLYKQRTLNESKLH